MVSGINQRIKIRDEQGQAALRRAIDAYLEDTPDLLPGARRKLPNGTIKHIDITLNPGSVDSDIQRNLQSAFDILQWSDLHGAITIHKITVEPDIEPLS